MNFKKGEVLFFNKPFGWTSFKVVGHARYHICRRIGVKKLKVGHAGTLDPLATGVMIVCTGKATKRIEEFQYHTKEYVATLRLGATTPSYDLEHEIDATYPTEHITRELVEEVLTHFIVAEIVITGKQRLKTVFDPTCGSGSLLLRTARSGKADEIFGQEKNPTTFNLCRMNMLLHGIKYNDFDIRNGDTLEADEFGDRQFDAVVANPPFSADWSAADKFNNDDRFNKAGVLAPKSKADYAFILHMIYHLNEGGTMACVAPHGVLFRGAAEGKIRRFLIEKKNYIDAIIGLPANIFYGTSIPTCILVMKKCRKQDDNILFIDASREFEKVKTQNKLRPEHIQKIIETYRNRSEIEKYSHCATLKEIEENDYNLNIPRYVDTFEEEEPIDIKAVMAEIKELEAKRSDLDKQIEVYLKELGIVE